MKRFVVVALIGLFAALAGCEDDDAIGPAPAAPQGVYTVTGNQAVYVYWNGVYDPDVREYRIWRSLERTTNYTEIGRRTADDNPDLDLLIYEYEDDAVTNGTTYYYAVSSVNANGRESDLSAEDAYDTPRPEGEVALFPTSISSALAGFNFETHSHVDTGTAATDVYVDIYGGTYFLNVGKAQTDIMDMGYTRNFDVISYAPSTHVDSGWSDLGYVELVQGHTYVVWTSDNHFAKMRAVSFNESGSVTFQWAWQVATGNPELVAPQTPMKHPDHGPEYLVKNVVSGSEATK